MWPSSRLCCGASTDAAAAVVAAGDSPLPPDGSDCELSWAIVLGLPLGGALCLRILLRLSWKALHERKTRVCCCNLKCPCVLVASQKKSTYAAPQWLSFFFLFIFVSTCFFTLFIWARPSSDFLFFDCGSWPEHCAPLLLQFSVGHGTEKQR